MNSLCHATILHFYLRILGVPSLEKGLKQCRGNAVQSQIFIRLRLWKVETTGLHNLTQLQFLCFNLLKQGWNPCRTSQCGPFLGLLYKENRITKYLYWHSPVVQQIRGSLSHPVLSGTQEWLDLCQMTPKSLIYSRAKAPFTCVACYCNRKGHIHRSRSWDHGLQPRAKTGHFSLSFRPFKVAFSGMSRVLCPLYIIIFSDFFGFFVASLGRVTVNYQWNCSNCSRLQTKL